jgi:hypothetical protein
MAQTSVVDGAVDLVKYVMRTTLPTPFRSVTLPALSGSVTESLPRAASS